MDRSEWPSTLLYLLSEIYCYQNLDQFRNVIPRQYWRGTKFRNRGQLLQNYSCYDTRSTIAIINDPFESNYAYGDANSKASGKAVQSRQKLYCFYKQQTLIKFKANINASGETARMRRLAWSFAVCIYVWKPDLMYCRLQSCDAVYWSVATGVMKTAGNHCRFYFRHAYRFDPLRPVLTRNDPHQNPH